ncbi:VWA containing CoxE family protein [Mycobacterium sp. 852002-50816_SCH5313054-b]|uniref:vWA domain-containing protein n=1 Tax=Mycobacterium sp. 852002-50816_SCH5313054-b TaxID=1834092 RepID=UPI000801046C|nr:VWA domain-containing protein [Mycobacterium sp. 852002-50816_SCH5313054-b]OBF59292.1 VWA containing CoxE family protein [Mycobacterium sp. 852002-50816_SCH5313054-b]
MSTPLLLRGVDLAAFAAALVARLRGAGMQVSANGPGDFVRALRRLVPDTTSALYWSARLTLVNRMEDLGAFDAVFDAVFGGTSADLTKGPEPALPVPGPKAPGAGTLQRSGSPSGGGAHGLPWVARAVTGDDAHETSVLLPDLLPSRIAARADEPFDRFDAQDLRLVGSWLEASVARWPRRRSMRFEPSAGGKRIDLRATMNASRETGWESIKLARTRPRRRPRRVVLACDVSRSMQPYVAVYLHLMRAAALRRHGMRPEVFAFSTSLTRLTSVLSHRSAEVALQKANATVTDRYGGTFIGRSLGALLTPPHGNALRGAVVIIASDGWDADPPDVLAHAMARLRRRAATLVWLNPRAAQGEFQPSTGSMAAALPYCDLFLPANSLTGLRELLLALTRPRLSIAP